MLKPTWLGFINAISYTSVGTRQAGSCPGCWSPDPGYLTIQPNQWYQRWLQGHTGSWIKIYFDVLNHMFFWKTNQISSWIFATFSVRGCWGWSMLLFWKLVDETQMSTPPEHTRHRDSRKLLILLPLRAIYFTTFQYETPCTFIFFNSFLPLISNTNSFQCSSVW